MHPNINTEEDKTELDLTPIVNARVVLSTLETRDSLLEAGDARERVAGLKSQ